MNRWLAAVMLASLASSAGSQRLPASATTQMQPAGKWAVEHADWQCILRRELSSAGQRSLFSLTLEPLTAVAWLKIATEGERGDRREDGDAVMLADGQRRAGTLHYNIYKAGKYRMREYMLDLDRHDLGSVNGSIRFWTKRHGDIDVKASGFKPAWNALKKCMTDLYASFGIVESQIASIATKPQGEIFEFVDFPRVTSGFDYALLYWVTPTGRVDECRLLKASGIAKFDNEVCGQLKAKARFKPARNAAGEAIRVPRFENASIRTTIISTTDPL